MSTRAATYQISSKIRRATRRNRQCEFPRAAPLHPTTAGHARTSCSCRGPCCVNSPRQSLVHGQLTAVVRGGAARRILRMSSPALSRVARPHLRSGSEVSRRLRCRSAPVAVTKSCRAYALPSEPVKRRSKKLAAWVGEVSIAANKKNSQGASESSASSPKAESFSRSRYTSSTRENARISRRFFILRSR